MAIKKTNRFSRESAEEAPGKIQTESKKQQTKDVETSKAGRNNVVTKVKSFSIRLDLIAKIDEYRITHRTEDGTIPSASRIVNDALETYLK